MRIKAMAEDVKTAKRPTPGSDAEWAERMNRNWERREYARLFGE